MGTQILIGDCRDTIRTLPNNSIDSVVCDPPYELGFMGKSWDSTGVAYDASLWAECLRVLKPGGHLLAFGGSRTYHRLACAVEDAGFEIRDQIMWVYGSGFPKSLNVGKAIDKAAGAERQVIGEKPYTNQDIRGGQFASNPHRERLSVPITAPATDEAKRWDGWGTALKPAHEPIVMARKPLVGTVAANVLEWGTGAINIDGCRVPGALEGDPNRFAKTDGGSFNAFSESPPVVRSEGRWPANFIHDGSDEVTDLFPDSKGGAYPAVRGRAVNTSFASGQETKGGMRKMGDDGSAARFFYCAKPNKKERNAGLEALPEVVAGKMMKNGNNTGNTSKGFEQFEPAPAANFHPTVKPLALMRYLVRMVTSPGGTVLDPFAGSGTTLMAAVMEHMNAIGCEMTEEYLPIIEGRVAWAEEQIKDFLF